MPLYKTKCLDCSWEDTLFRKVADRDNLPSCHCQGKLTRLISAPMVLTDIEPYISPATGRIINSRVAMRDDLNASGSILNEPGLKQDIARQKKYVEEKTFAPVAAGIDAAVTQLVNNRQLES